ncbi:MAG: SDR family oxidoreductase [Ardenticatenaceae bacterium]|nr:SDR family oxidoreductase [Ardenticatenaceae bacterium]MCB8989156.1 SDR family oxidoreductase [Ardenticatenaceae bacterium]
MKNIVITGSTRGIGYGLAHEFLARGCRVTINGRSPNSVTQALTSLSQIHGNERLHGCAANVTHEEELQTVWDTAVARFGSVDIWINNAGVGHPMQMVWELPQAAIDQVIDIDFKGLVYGSRVAIRNMLQQGHGHLYNMEGFGSNGRIRAGISVYGSTKAAVRFLSRSLTQETADTAVKVSTLSPGIVITDFLTDQYKDDPAGLEQAKKVFNSLGDKVETVTPWLVEKVLANDKSGANISWLTPVKLFTRLAMQPFSKRDLFT